jgi:hypothetical protein
MTVRAYVALVDAGPAGGQRRNARPYGDEGASPGPRRASASARLDFNIQILPIGPVAPPRLARLTRDGGADRWCSRAVPEGCLPTTHCDESFTCSTTGRSTRIRWPTDGSPATMVAPPTPPTGRFRRRPALEGRRPGLNRRTRTAPTLRPPAVASDVNLSPLGTVMHQLLKDQLLGAWLGHRASPSVSAVERPPVCAGVPARQFGCRALLD